MIFDSAELCALCGKILEMSFRKKFTVVKAEKSKIN